MVNLQYRIFPSEIDIIEWADQPQCLYYDYSCLLSATISNLNQPLIPWYNPFGDTLASPTLCVHPFLSLFRMQILTVKALSNIANRQCMPPYLCTCSISGLCSPPQTWRSQTPWVPPCWGPRPCRHLRTGSCCWSQSPGGGGGCYCSQPPGAPFPPCPSTQCLLELPD